LLVIGIQCYFSHYGERVSRGVFEKSLQQQSGSGACSANYTFQKEERMKTIIIAIAIAFLLPIASTALADDDATEDRKYYVENTYERQMRLHRMTQKEIERRKAREEAKREEWKARQKAEQERRTAREEAERERRKAREEAERERRKAREERIAREEAEPEEAEPEERKQEKRPSEKSGKH
jgi:hypothetical protein